MQKKSRILIRLERYTILYILCSMFVIAKRILDIGFCRADIFRVLIVTGLLYVVLFCFFVAVQLHCRPAQPQRRSGAKRPQMKQRKPSLFQILNRFCKRFWKKSILLLPIALILVATILVLHTHSGYSFRRMLNRLPSAGSDISADLAEFAQKYPETKEFVDNYDSLKDKEFDMDISDELKEGEIPLFLQWDKRWGYKDYGSSIIGLVGCGPTCLSMVASGLTGNAEYTPYYMAKFSEENGYYQKGEGTSWELMTTGAQALGLESAYGYVREDYITEQLFAGTPLICSMLPGDFTYGGHFIVLTGIDPDGRIIVNDPNSPSKSAKHWELDTLLPQIRSLWYFQVAE